MPILTIVLIITGVLIIICLALPLIDKKRGSKKAGQLFLLLSQAGTEHHLSFSSQDMINGNAMGLDGVKRKLIILNKASNGKHKEIMINLNEVKDCSVIKAYGPLPIENSINRLPEAQLQKMALRFKFHNNRMPIEVDFYDPLSSVHEYSRLQQKLKDWETILSKMLKEPSYFPQ